MAYGWSIAVGVLHAVLVGLSGLWLFFIVTFPWENQEDPGSDDWLMVVSSVMLAAAALVLFGVVTRFAWLVVAAFSIGAAAGGLALSYGVREWSSHGDEELLAFGVIVGATGLLATVLSVRAARQRL